MGGKGGLVKAGLFGAVGINAVPVTGTLAGGWPPETTLAVYLVETLLLVAIIAVRLRLLAPERLETQSGKMQSRAEFIQGFLLLCGGLSVGAAIFNAFFLSRSINIDITIRALGASLPVFLGVELLILAGDVLLMRRASQPVAEGWAVRGMRRIVVLFFAVWLGMAAALFAMDWFIWPFIGLKLLMDVGIALEQALAHLRGTQPTLRMPEVTVTATRRR